MTQLHQHLTEGLFCFHLVRPWVSNTGPQRPSCKTLISGWEIQFPGSLEEDRNDILTFLHRHKILSWNAEEKINFLCDPNHLSQVISLYTNALNSIKTKHPHISITHKIPRNFDQPGGGRILCQIKFSTAPNVISHVGYCSLAYSQGQFPESHMQMTYLRPNQCRKLATSGTLTLEVEQVVTRGSASLISFFWDLGGTWAHSQVQLFVPEQEDRRAFDLLAAKNPYAPRKHQTRERNKNIPIPKPEPSHVKQPLRELCWFQQKKKFKAQWAPELTEQSYQSDFDAALHREKFALDEDLDIYQLDNARLSRITEDIFSLFVPGLRNKRPSLMVNDSAFFFCPYKPDTDEIGGRIVNVDNDTIQVKVIFLLDTSLLYSVRFESAQIPLRRMLTALEALEAPHFERLFPKPVQGRSDEQLELPDIVPIQAHLNENQTRAVQNILVHLRGKRTSPYIIFGPPGTGKTHTVTETILQILQRDPKARILVCTASNAAADVIAARLVDNNPNLSLVRFLSVSRSTAIARNPQLATPEYAKIQRFIALQLNESNENANVVVSTCSSAWNVSGKFDFLFIDEAGQAMEPEVLIPLTIALPENPGLQVVLAGDPKQLGPVIRCNFANNPLKVSLLERIATLDSYSRHSEKPELSGYQFYDPAYITKLVENYRSHHTILQKPSELFYDGELIPRMARFPFEDWEGLPNPKVPMVFHSVEGIEEREGRSPSYFNRLEAVKVMNELVKICQANRIPNLSVGIITPYHQQKLKIQLLYEDYLNQYPILEQISEFHVGSVEEFQGNERDVIIISTVRSNVDPSFQVFKDLGFLVCPNRLNVSITRPRHLLIFVGNAGLLSLDQNWGAIVDHCKSLGCIDGNFITYFPLQSPIPSPETNTEDFAGHNTEM